MPAAWVCYEPACDHKALCDEHVPIHRRRGHNVMALTPEDGPSPESMRGVTVCTKPGHVGLEGRYSHYCHTCAAPACLRCSVDDHVAVGHSVVPVATVGRDAVGFLSAALPTLQEGVAHQCRLAATARQGIASLTASRAQAEGAIAARYATLLEALQRERDGLLRAVTNAHDAKVAALTRVLTDTRCGAGELRTVLAAVQRVLASGDPLSAIHMRDTLTASSQRARDRGDRPVDTTLHVAPDMQRPVFPLGSLVTWTVDPGRCKVTVLEPARAGSLPGLMVTVRTLDGSPANVPMGAVRVTSVLRGKPGVGAAVVGPVAGPVVHTRSEEAVGQALPIVRRCTHTKAPAATPMPHHPEVLGTLGTLGTLRTTTRSCKRPCASACWMWTRLHSAPPLPPPPPPPQLGQPYGRWSACPLVCSGPSCKEQCPPAAPVMSCTCRCMCQACS